MPRLLASVTARLPSTVLWFGRLRTCHIRYVNLEELHAAVDPAYKYGDEIQGFPGGFVLVKREQNRPRKNATTGRKRVFPAWSSGVTFIYLHRVEELAQYKRIIEDLFINLSWDG